MKRRYELKRRAERQAETRRRIVEAAVALHTTIGPARTSISAIAERAGVQRLTVYAHFPDERRLFRACSGHWRAQNPFPDPNRWWRIDDPERRLRTALRDVYAWYERLEPQIAVLRRDAALLPVQAEITRETDEALKALARRLAAGFARPRRVRAAIGHALTFETWRSLERGQAVSRRRSVGLMVGLVRCAADGVP